MFDKKFDVLQVLAVVWMCFGLCLCCVRYGVVCGVLWQCLGSAAVALGVACAVCIVLWCCVLNGLVLCLGCVVGVLWLLMGLLHVCVVNAWVARCCDGAVVVQCWGWCLQLLWAVFVVF